MKRKALHTKESGVLKQSKHEAAAVGFVLTVGDGDMAQLGLGPSKPTRKKPALVPTLAEEKIIQVAASGLQSAALTHSGDVFTWGCNDDGALGRSGDEWIPAKADFPSDALVTSIALGSSCMLSLTSAGEVYFCGAFRDNSGMLGSSKTVDIQSTPTLVPGLAGKVVVSIAAGENHALALTQHGQVYEWGDVRVGHRQSRRIRKEKLAARAVRFPKNARIHKIFVSHYSNFAITTDGLLFCWGLNNYNQFGNDTAANILKPTLIKHDVFGDNKIVKIAGGVHHSLFLLSDHSVWSCGRGHYGRLGHGDTADAKIPKKIEACSSIPGQHVVDIGCGSDHSMAVLQSGRLLTWGSSTNLQLGHGHDDDVLTPTLVESQQLTTFKRAVLQCDGAAQHSIFLVADADPKQKKFFPEE